MQLSLTAYLNQTSVQQGASEFAHTEAVISAYQQRLHTQFDADIQSLPYLKRRQLKAKAEQLCHLLNQAMRSNDQRRLDIAIFVAESCKILSQQHAFVIKAVSSFAMALLVDVLAASVGVGVGMYLGIWAGPLAFIAAIQLANTTALSILAVSGGLGIAAGYAASRLFKPVSEVKQRTVVDRLTFPHFQESCRL